jgi:hypothetical protein
MAYNYLTNKKYVFFILLVPCLLFTKQSFAQLIYQPYSYQFYQKLDAPAYSPATELHTALKPYLFSDSSQIRRAYDSLTMQHTDNTGKSWAHRALFSGHLAEAKTKSYSLYLDYLPDLQIGKELINKQTTYLNTRGFQVGATIGSNFFVYTSAYENDGKFPNYINTYINQSRQIPGEVPISIIIFDAGSLNWTYVTSLIGYTPTKNITITLGQDKIFIGDGYRSVLLSDFAPAYPLLRFTINLTKNIQYSAIWAYMEDENAPQFNSFVNNRRKWGAYHYIDWNITNRASLGFFNAIIDEEADNQGNLHGFDVNYFNPLFFASSLGPSNPVPDHTLIGFNGKYKVLNKTTLYGQLLFDQSATASGGVSAWQLGLRGADLFKVKNLNYIFEYNTSAANTYYGQNALVNYTQLSEPLADPLGSNFKELLGIINYSAGRFDLQFEGDYAKLGANTAVADYGNYTPQPGYIYTPQVIGISGPSVPTTLKYAEGTIAYVLNPKYNLRIEIGGLLRQEKSSISDTKTALFTIGLRSSFRNLYHDF